MCNVTCAPAPHGDVYQVHCMTIRHARDVRRVHYSNIISHTEQQVVTLRVCASRWTEVCGGIGSQRTQQRKMAPLLKITIVLVIRSIFVECR